MTTHALRQLTADRLPAQCSKVTNGKTLFAEGGDMRGPWARRLRDVFSLHLSDLGGADAVSEAERSIVRRAAVLTVELERIEAKFAVDGGLPGDLDLYQRTAGNLRRLLESVGLQRRAKDVGSLTLADLLREDQIEQRREAAARVVAVAADAADDDATGLTADDEAQADEPPTADDDDPSAEAATL